MPKKTRPVVMIIDAHAIIHRAFHALPPLSTKEGTMVNAVYGFLAILFKAIKQLRPTHVAVAFDPPGPTFRHKQYPAYKATREKQPNELYQQIPIVKEFVDTLGFRTFEQTGYEADDIIGTLVHTLAKSATTYIVTGDLDTLQLVDDHTKVYAMRKGMSDTVVYDVNAVRERFGGLTPNQMIDYKALCGDSSDNIPGVHGVGDKTAIQLLGKYKTLESVLQHTDEQPKRLRSQLEAGRKEAQLSKQLVTIASNIPLHVTVNDLAMQPSDRSRLISLLQRFEFKSLLKSLSQLPSVPSDQAVLPHLSSADQLQQESHPQAQKESEADRLSKSGYQLVDSVHAVKELAKHLAQQTIIAVDTETTSLNTFDATLVGVSICWKSSEAYYIPMPYAKELYPILTNPGIQKIGHNIKFDYKILRMAEGITLRGIICDTMFASYVLNPGTRGHGLDNLAFTEFGYEMMSYEALVGKGKDQRIITEVPIRTLAFYAAEDAEYTWRLFEVLMPRIQQHKLGNILELEVSLIPVLAEMELAGISIDVPYLKKLQKRFASECARLEKKIHSLAGTEFNIASPKQLKMVLFDTLKLETKGLAKTKTGISTAAGELEKMRGMHPIIDLISEYREVAKLQSTYVEALPRLVHPRTKRLHTTYQQTITATGRLSSTDPNVQNIPIRTPLGREIRQAFIASPGNVLASLDYSQIELRIIAHIANDEPFIAGFKRGADIHAQTAAEINGITENNVTPEMRRAAKAINFGIIYGMGVQGLARDAGMKANESKTYLERYFKIHPAIAQYIEATKASARQNGYVATLFGRRRYLPDIRSGMPAVRAAAERAAINMPAQGSSADIIKFAMVAIARNLADRKSSATLLLQVHDELVFEIPEAKANEEVKIIQHIMESVVPLRVPLVVAVGIGHNWNEV